MKDSFKCATCKRQSSRKVANELFGSQIPNLGYCSLQCFAKKIQINFKELAHIMEIPERRAKSIVETALNVKAVKADSYVHVDKLVDHFPNAKSVDVRFDGVSQLLFNLATKSENWRKHTKDKGAASNLMLGGGKSVYYKIMTDEQKQRLFQALDYQHFHRYGVVSLEDQVDKLKELGENQFYHITGRRINEF